MTKKELIKKIDELGSKVEVAIGSTKSLLEELKEVYSDIEELPTELDEIEEDEKEEV